MRAGMKALSWESGVRGRQDACGGERLTVRDSQTRLTIKDSISLLSMAQAE